jgi:superfamily I DNA/RNA helicase
VVRLGRKTRLPEGPGRILWSIFERVIVSLNDAGLVTPSGAYRLLSTAFGSKTNPPYDYAVIDEAQDLSVGQLRFLSIVGNGRPDALFFAGDLGQRIFQQPFSWKSLGVDIRGRPRQLRINYQTSHQIRQKADRLLGPELADPDGNQENRSDTISVFNGPPPEITTHATEKEEATAIGAWNSGRSQ